MSTRIVHTPSRGGDLISERVARRATAHRRPRVAPEPAAAPGAPASPAVAVAEPTATPAPAAKILRRWSVAELIARAAAGHPVVA